MSSNITLIPVIPINIVQQILIKLNVQDSERRGEFYIFTCLEKYNQTEIASIRRRFANKNYQHLIKHFKSFRLTYVLITRFLEI